MKSNGLRVRVKKTKTVISGENAVKVSVEGKFSIAVCRQQFHPVSVFQALGA